MQIRAAVAVGALALSVAACGQRPAPRAQPPVRLTVDEPVDGVTLEGESVQVSGRVWPTSATVLVQGRRAAVVKGQFNLTVALNPGANIVDVVAGADPHPAAMTALRVVRVIPVVIPDLSGQAVNDSVKRLKALGLDVSTDKQGGLIDDLIPGTDGVCETDPKAGTKVRPGSKVTVTYAKVC